MSNGPKILYVDIETFELTVRIWSLGKQYVGVDQLTEDGDWTMASWSAIWNDDPPNKAMYEDRKNGRSEKSLLKNLYKLFNEADIIITQNGKKFDAPKIRAKFIEHGYKPPSPFFHIDTYKIGKKHFGFTSHKLAYMCKKLGLEYQKDTHSEFPGRSLWHECEKNNLKAWKVMEKYNKYDILSLRALYKRMQAWEPTLDFGIYSDRIEMKCNCGSTHLQSRGVYVTKTSRFKRFQCQDCGKWFKGPKLPFSKEKRASLLTGIS